MVLPNSIKEIPFALLGLISILFFIRERQIDGKIFFMLSSFFAISVISLLYTADIKYGLNRIEGLLPLLYITFSYAVFSKMKIRFEKEFVRNWIVLFNTASFLFLVVFSCYFYFQKLELNYNNIRTALDEIPLIGMHPIYVSITAVLGILTCVYGFRGAIKTSSFFIVTNLVLLVISGSRATFIGFLMLLFLWILFSKIDKKAKFGLVSSSVISLCLLFMLNTDFKIRFQEMILPVSYSKVNPNNSTSVRYAVWSCSLEQIKKSNIVLGNGIGDVPTVLQSCYDAKYPDLGQYYNSHNQYFSIILGSGLIGLISLAGFFICLFVDGLKNKNKYLLIVITFYLYMFIFENIMERKYGILLLLFFMLYVFNLFPKMAEEKN